MTGSTSDGSATTPATASAPEPDGQTTSTEPGAVTRGSAREVLWVATRLGLTSFGGPIAHIGYFREEYVVRRGWLDDRNFADLVALSQFLPGAASSKLGMSIGILRAGPLGGFFSWLGFTLPSAIALVVAALVLDGIDSETVELMHGLKVVAVAVVAHAVWGMARNLAPDRPRAAIAMAATAAVLLLPIAYGHIAVIVLAALVGWRFLRSEKADNGPGMKVPLPRWLGVVAIAILLGLLAGLPLARTLFDSQPLAMFDSFYRSGSLVFGGGHVVLPLLQAEVVPPGWVGQDPFLTGYGLAQAVPGPLFTFGSYLGAAMEPEPNGLLGAAIALIAIFLPSMLITIGALPWWGTVRSRPAAQAALRGVNAAVVGILLAALYDPIWTSAILRPVDFVLALGAFGLLAIGRFPPWTVVLLTAVVGALVA